MTNQLQLQFEAVVDRDTATICDSEERVAYHQVGGEETVHPAWHTMTGFFQGMVGNVRACVLDEPILVRVTITEDEAIPA
jgi:hypothetical protein